MGPPRPDEPLSHGCFVTPTVVTNVEETMSIWRDEVFGPVVAVRVVDGFDAAVQAANDSAYGLAASVFTRDLAYAYAFADRVDIGQVVGQPADLRLGRAPRRSAASPTPGARRSRSRGWKACASTPGSKLSPSAAK